MNLCFPCENHYKHFKKYFLKIQKGRKSQEQKKKGGSHNSHRLKNR
jgi:hypothetical protein